MQELKPLVVAARDGDRDAYAGIVRRFQDMAVGYARSRLGDSQLAEDAAQEAFIEAYAKLDQLRRAAAFAGWFRAVLHSVCERLRQRPHMPLEDEILPAAGDDPARLWEKDRERETVRREVAALPEDERLVITLAYTANCSHRQIADFLRIGPDQVNNSLRRARSRLAARLRCPARRLLRGRAPSRTPTFSREVNRMIKPVEFAETRPEELPGGHTSTNDEVWLMLNACRSGDLERVKSLAEACPGLIHCAYNYTPPIHFAVREGHAAVVRYLLDHGADPTYRSYSFRDSLLQMAVERGHTEVEALVREALGRRLPSSEEATRLLEACGEGDAARVGEILAADPDLARAADETGDTPLHRACAAGEYDLVRQLVEAGADVSAVRGDGFKPVHSALFSNGQGWVVRGSSDVALRAGRIVGYLLEQGEEYTVFLAAVLGDMGALRRMLEADAKLANFSDTHRRRPLSAAAWRGDTAMVRLLLEYGADPSLPENDAPRGHAAWIAAFCKNGEMLGLLLEHGADPEASAESGGRALDHVRDEPELYALLVEHGARENQAPEERVFEAVSDREYDKVDELLKEHPGVALDPAMFWGEGILVLPAREADWRMLELLESHGARVPSTSKWGKSYYFKHLEVGEHLLKKGMDPNHMNWHRTSLLHDMAWHGDEDKAVLLLAHGADIDAVDEEYRSTPLGLAARAGRLDMVRLLLERGADPGKAGAPWATPLAWALRGGFEEIAELLRERMG